MTKIIGIMGCGWFGLPLAKALLKDNFSVKGTTTSLDKIKILENEGILAFEISVSETGIKGPIVHFLEDLNVLVINVPPGLRGKATTVSYIDRMRTLLKAIKKSNVQKVIFVSSTSVYSDEQGHVSEEMLPLPTTASGKQLLQSENLFKTETAFQTTVVRFGGLIGPNRHPVHMLSGKQNLKNGNAPVNLIHLNDCIAVLTAILKEEKWGEIFNVVYPEHPSKQEYYTNSALSKGITPPLYTSSDTKQFKTVYSCKKFITKKYSDFTSI